MALVSASAIVESTLFIKYLDILSKDTQAHHTIRCEITFGTKYNIVVNELELRRMESCKDKLLMYISACYYIGQQRHGMILPVKIPHVFQERAVLLDDENKTVISAALKSMFKQVSQICNVCLKQKTDWDEKTQTCEACIFSSILSKLLHFEEKVFTIGPFEQKECSICQEKFTPTAPLGQMDQCGHLFHYGCLCGLKKPSCPLCNTSYHRIKRVADRHWTHVDLDCFEVDSDSEGDF